MSTTITAPPLTFDAARAITNKIKATAESLWLDLKQAHDGEAWRALSYGSWQEYVQREFDMTKQRSYQLLDYARLREVIGDESTTVDSIPSERAARPLAQLPPEAQAAVWTEIKAECPTGKPSAEVIKAAVVKVKPVVEKLPRYIPANALQYADMAIANLQHIQPDDTERRAAATKVIRWAVKHLTDRAPKTEWREPFLHLRKSWSKLSEHEQADLLAFAVEETTD